MDKLIVEFSNYFETEMVDEYTSAILDSEGNTLINARVPEKMLHVVTVRCEHCENLTTSYLDLHEDQRDRRLVKIEEDGEVALVSFVTYKLVCKHCEYVNNVLYDVESVGSTKSKTSKIVGSKLSDAIPR